MALVAVLAALGATVAADAEGGADIVFENDCARWVIGGDGRNQQFIDRAAGDVSVPQGAQRRRSRACALRAVARCRERHGASDTVRLSFAGIEARHAAGHHAPAPLRGEVAQADPAVEELQFPNLQLSLKGPASRTLPPALLR
jgi:hypothetical protein